jgi:hypothetical protein
MKSSKLLIATAAMLLAAVAAPAQAQLGGLKPKIPGLGSGGGSASTVSAADIDDYIDRAQKNADLLTWSYILVQQAREGKINIAATAAQRQETLSSPDAKVRSAKQLELIKGADNSTALNDQSVADFTKTIADASPAVRAQIGNALFNLAVAIPRAVQLVGEAPDLIKGLGTNPSALGNVGKLKNAASLLASQVKSTAQIAPYLPKLMSAAKVKPPVDAKTSKTMPLDGIT